MNFGGHFQTIPNRQISIGDWKQVKYFTTLVQVPSIICKPGMAVSHVAPALGRQRQPDRRGLLVSQSTWSSEFGDHWETLSQQNKKAVEEEIVNHCPPHIYTVVNKHREAPCFIFGFFFNTCRPHTNMYNQLTCSTAFRTFSRANKHQRGSLSMAADRKPRV